MKVKLLYPGSKAPTKGHPDDVGFDVFSYDIEDCGHYIKVFSGIAIQPEDGYWYALVSRSSTHKNGLILYNSIGIIDSTFRGEIVGMFLKTEGYKLPALDSRLLQLIPQKLHLPELTIVEELDETARGSGGFGSTGR